MNREAEVFELIKTLDNPHFKGFGFARGEKSRIGRGGISEDFVAQDTVANRGWKVESLRQSWTDVAVTGDVRAYNDYPCIGLSIPAFSQRATLALADMLLPNGEILPLNCARGVYNAYNLTTVADAMDIENASIEFLRPAAKARALSVSRFEFTPAKLQGLTIFRLVELPNQTFVTSEFVQAVHDAGLNGLNFVKLWPYPPGVGWEDAQKHDHEVAVMNEAVHIDLKLQDDRPSLAEKKIIRQFKDEILAIFSNKFPSWCTCRAKIDAEETARGTYRISLSCTNSKVALLKLAPWAESNNWASEVRLS